jgi:hypothetical protein
MPVSSILIEMVDADRLLDTPLDRFNPGEYDHGQRYHFEYW